MSEQAGTSTEPKVVETDSSTEPKNVEKQIRILDMPTGTQNESLQCIVQFLSLAQRRGAFQLEEAAKIVDCLKLFSSPSEA